METWKWKLEFEAWFYSLATTTAEVALLGLLAAHCNRSLNALNHSPNGSII